MKSYQVLLAATLLITTFSRTSIDVDQELVEHVRQEYYALAQANGTALPPVEISVNIQYVHAEITPVINEPEPEVYFVPVLNLHQALQPEK